MISNAVTEYIKKHLLEGKQIHLISKHEVVHRTIIKITSYSKSV